MDKKIEEIRVLESRLQSLLAKKQELQISLNEIETALSQVNSSSGDVYQITSSILIKTTPEKAEESLKSQKKEALELLEKIQNQEKIILQNINSLKEDILKSRNKNQ